MCTKKIDATDRQFWELIARAAFANPFSPERRELNVKITGSAKGDPAVLSKAISDRLKKSTTTHARFTDFAEGDREVMRHAFLFEIYHRFFDAFDDFLLTQLKAGETPCKVRFAGELLDLLATRGFAREDALRYFGLFYQLRRAHFFIVRGLIGQSSSMEELRRRLWNNVFTSDIRCYDQFLWNRMEDFSTMLLGETGTGKGAAAAAIGRSGFIPYNERTGCFVESFAQNFISLNLSQFSETLIESELFGHSKGAFTGAIQPHDGVFARCSPHGAIFLDEIGDVSVPIQIKLLHVLQERVFSPVGSRAKVAFRGRVIAATNKPVEKLREEKLFRDDFYYRLCSDIIVVPTLRQRFEELPSEFELLVSHIAKRMVGDSGNLADIVHAKLKAAVPKHYSWPGNVRELEQAVRRILVTDSYQVQSTQNGSSAEHLIGQLNEGAIDADTLLSRYCRLLYQRFGTFEEVARRANLDPRTVKRYLDQKSSTAAAL